MTGRTNNRDVVLRHNEDWTGVARTRPMLFLVGRRQERHRTGPNVTETETGVDKTEGQD